MLVLGVDPGLARTGVAVVSGRPGSLQLVEAVCIETRPGRPDAARLLAVFEALDALVLRLRPEVAAVEKLFFATNRRSAMRVSEARGAALCAIARHGVTVAEYTPLQVKEAVAGWGAAEKRQVGRMVAALLGENGIAGPDDVADACAVAVCHHHRAGLSALALRQGADPGTEGRAPSPPAAHGGETVRMSVALRAAVERAAQAAATEPGG
ncbi:MAG: crossover junction endodeoxyribonuclease RuvC [Candidatus Dormibacteria bacterium]